MKIIQNYNQNLQGLSDAMTSTLASADVPGKEGHYTPPSYKEKDLLSFSSLAIPFTFDTSLATKCFASECIQILVQTKQYMDILAERRAAYRLTVVMLKMFKPSAGAGARLLQQGIPF